MLWVAGKCVRGIIKALWGLFSMQKGTTRNGLTSRVDVCHGGCEIAMAMAIAVVKCLVLFLPQQTRVVRPPLRRFVSRWGECCARYQTDWPAATEKTLLAGDAKPRICIYCWISIAI